MSRSLSEVLATHISDATFSSLPGAEIEAASTSLIETIGVALGARHAPGTEEILRVCREEAGSPQSTIWTTGERVTARQAGFVNSVFGAALDYDSVFHEGIVHSDIIVVPTAVAVAESLRLPGRDLLTAIALGNDVLCRLSLATKPPKKGWFFSSVYGVLVSAAITAKLLRADTQKIVHAMGLASLNAAGTYQPMAERSLSKRALAAFAVQAGIHCGQLAAAGFEGVSAPLEGAHGLFALYNEGDVTKATEGLGEHFLGSRIGRKPYPSCQCNHAPIEAVLMILQEHELNACDIENVEVVLSPHARRLVGGPYDHNAASQTAAQFSVQYSIACALLRGQLGISEIHEPALSDPDIAAFADRVLVTEDARNSNAYVPATVVVRLRNGTTLARTEAKNRGSADLPLARTELLGKFSDCVRSAYPSVSAPTVEEIFTEMTNVHESPDIARTLSHLTRRWSCA